MFPLYALTLFQTAKKFISPSPVVRYVQKTLEPYVPLTRPDDLFAKINQYRTTQDLPVFVQDDTTCSAASSLSTHPEATQDEVFGVCATCTHAALLSISKYAYPNQILSRFLEETGSAKIFADPQLTHLCIKETDSSLLLFLARQNGDPSTPAAPQTPKPRPVTVKNFTEDELWQALVDYRHAHKKPDLLHTESLCEYARKRVSDHLTAFSQKEPETYPVPEKYPLDAHQGFAADAASGYAFDVTGMNQLAENLAYWPDAQYPHQIIEWGWDSSTEGHREAQLSVDYNHACLAGSQGFYVAIFGR
jgi:hypothetical protein